MSGLSQQLQPRQPAQFQQMQPTTCWYEPWGNAVVQRCR
jgi:hypothetical protein